MLTEVEWAWIAGIYEGEGSLEFTNKTGVRIRIGMTDLDVIEHLYKVLPSAVRMVGKEKAGRRKTLYTYCLTDRDEVRAFLVGVMPYLHSRRGARAEAALRRLEKNLGAYGKRTHCPYGHPLEGENLNIDPKTGGRSCYTCRRIRDRQRHARDRVARNKARTARHAAKRAAA